MSCASLHASITLKSFGANLTSPQKLGTVVTFTATAVDSTPNPVTFQFNVSFNQGAYVTVRNYNIGLHIGPTGWQSEPFVWTQIQTEGSYTIQVIARDFHTGDTARATFPFTLTSAVANGKLTVLPTANPLVALAAIPPCPLGSSARVLFRRTASSNATRTSFVACSGTTSSNLYLGGLYAGAAYAVSYQIQTNGNVAPGASTATYTAGQIPDSLALPSQVVVQPATPAAYTTDDVIVHAYINNGPTDFQPIATDLQGNPIWFYQSGETQALLTRPLPGGYFFVLQSGTAWNNRTTEINQLLRRVDLAGNIVQETNVGLMQQQLLNMGATDLQPCGNIPIPAPVGSACLTALSHDAILLSDGSVAVIGSMEKIFAPGTQGNTSGLNVDVLGDAIIVLDNNWNVSWYWDAFEHDSGGTQLDIQRPAVLGETCAPGVSGCPTLFLCGTPGVDTPANDWMHSNSLYYNPSNGDFLLSARHQDWVLKIDYANGAGTSNIDYRLGLNGDFTINNVYNDPYPWFSHQHDAGLEVQNGLFDCFDNGNTRISVEGGGDSRGMALSVDLNSMTVTPVVSQDLGYFALALGSAQLLPNGNYHFQAGIVTANTFDYSLEYEPSAGTDSAALVYGLASESFSYRSFRQTDLYSPPTT